MTKKIIFTIHARQRALDRCGLTEQQARNVLLNSREIEIPLRRWGYKFQQYGKIMGDTHLFYDPYSYVSFTIIDKEDCFLVVTVVKKKYKKPVFLPENQSLKPPIDNKGKMYYD